MSQQVDIGASAGEGKGKMTGSMGHMSPDEPLAESEVHCMPSDFEEALTSQILTNARHICGYREQER